MTLVAFNTSVRAPPPEILTEFVLGVAQTSAFKKKTSLNVAANVQLSEKKCMWVLMMVI